jgi:hypothetical protein
MFKNRFLSVQNIVRAQKISELYLKVGTQIACKKQGTITDVTMKLKTTLIAATLLLSITSAQAALVESDWKSTGDALATLDTETGI